MNRPPDDDPGDLPRGAPGGIPGAPPGNGPPDDPASEAPGEILAFARERLGPASERHLAHPDAQARVRSRRRCGSDREDAILGELYRAADDDREVANEFAAYFLCDLLRLGHRATDAGLRRFLDSGDLVQSIFGDLWQDLRAVRFDTRAGFLAYLARKLRWKAADRGRSARREANRGRRRAERDALTDEAPTGASPVALAIDAEERERLILLLLRLSERDRELLTLFLKGLDLAEIATRMKLSRNAARVALQRALERARELG